MGLFGQGPEDSGVAMALIYGGIGGQTVQVFAAFHVPDPDAFAAGQHDVQGHVVFGSELVLQSDIIFGFHGMI